MSIKFQSFYPPFLIPPESCSAVEVPVYETRGFFGYVDKDRGFCSNEQVLHGLTKCGGQCSTESHYSDRKSDFLTGFLITANFKM